MKTTMTRRSAVPSQAASVCLCVSALLAVAGCTALKNPNDRAADASVDSGLDGGRLDAGPRDLGPWDDLGPQPDLGPPDLGPTDMSFECAPTPSRPTGDARWPQYRLPDTPGHPRSYQVLGTAPNQTVIDCVTGLEWERAIDPGTFTRDLAITHCTNLRVAGHLDWRLPSTIELMTLVDYAVAYPGPTIDTTAFPGTPADISWSSSSVGGSPSYGWVVYFSSGDALNGGDGTGLYRARCVR